MEGVLAALSRVPIMLLAMLYCGWLGYDYYAWLNDPQSTLGQRKASIVSARHNQEAVKKKLAEAQAFFKELDVIRARIQQLTLQLDSTKSNLSGDIDIANFVNVVTHEAKKLGLVVRGIKPEQEIKKEYYIEVPFTVTFRGAYVQALVFFDRVAKFQQVVRVSDFEMKPSSNVFTKYVELDGSVKLVTFRYLGTQADEIRHKEEMKSLDASEAVSRPAPTAAPEGGGK